ncbi:fungal-specific transcription factor domain-containing protein [Ilyonectria destructans]|nr:fungal-specific transcription factor domain-containing protein [Ilyonectria destructans]
MSTSTAGTPIPVSHKPWRILACTLCQRRKAKCDHKMPCSNCIKANLTCTPSTPAPARKPQRPNQVLKERLRRCEWLLEQRADVIVSVPPSAQSMLPLTIDSPSKPPAGTQGPEQHRYKQKPLGKLVREEGGAVRFMDSYVWASVHDELQAMKDIVNMDEQNEWSMLEPEDMNLYHNIDLLGPHPSTRCTIEFWPDPVHIFKLWQFFLDRVNPLVKVIHVPTLQPYLAEAATNMDNVALNYQCLLFSIFILAVISMSETESIQILGITRDQALVKYTLGTKNALTQFNFLKNFDMAALQALLLYQISLHNRYDRHASWVLSGVAVRIAQKMGYHRDGEQLGLPPFETEMRRRIWWQILVHDSKTALVSGLNDSLLPTNWDTKPAQNLNDADMFPGSTEPAKPREGPTEMGFCLLTYQITKFMIAADGIHGRPDFEDAITGQSIDDDESRLRALESYRALIHKLDQNLRTVEARYIDVTAGPIHAAALTIRPMLISKLKEMLVPMTQQPQWGTEIFNAKDNLFKIVIMNHEHSTNGYEIMVQNGFFWFAKLHFQLHIFAAMTGQLCHRPTGSLADRAWNIMEKIHTYHSELFDMTQKPYCTQAQFTLRAWKAREKAYAEMGQTIELPDFIHRLRESAPIEFHDSEAPSPTHFMLQMMVPPQTTEFDQSLYRYLDTSVLNWGMWGDMLTPDNGNMTENSSSG